MVNKNEIPLERDIVARIKGYLKKAGIWHVKIHGYAFQALGLPDIICIVGGRFVGLEVKRPKLGKVTDIQRATLEKINHAGGYATVVTCVEDVRAAVEAAKDGEVAAGG